MKNSSNLYKHHRFPPSVIQYAVWVYFRFNLSIRDVEDLLAQRGLIVSYEAIRLWVNKFGPKYAKKLKRKHGNFGDTFYIDEVFIKIDGIFGPQTSRSDVLTPIQTGELKYSQLK